MPSFLDTIRQAAARIFQRAPAPVVSRATVPSATVPHDLAVEGSARSWIEWSPTLIEAAEIQCDGGSLRMAGDLCHALQGDDRILATTGVLARGLVGLPLSFESGGDRRKSRRVLRAIEADEDWWQMAPESTLAELVLWGVLLGVGFAKLVPAEGVSGRGLLRVEVWDPRWFRWDHPTRRWWVTLDTGVEIPVETDGRWVIYTPFGEHAPWRRGVWRALARWWLLKHYARNDWARHSEVKAAGVLVGFSTLDAKAGQPDLSPTQRQRLASQLRTLGRDAVVMLPRGLDLKLVESTAKNFETYQAQIEAANTGITIAVLAQNLSTEVKGGSYAAAQVHQQVADFLRRALAESLSTTLHDQVLVFWAAWNFSDPGVAPWPRWKVDPDADVSALGAAYKALGEGLAALEAVAPPGQVVDRAAIFERAGIPLMDAPDPEPPALPGEQGMN